MHRAKGVYSRIDTGRDALTTSVVFLLAGWKARQAGSGDNRVGRPSGTASSARMRSAMMSLASRAKSTNFVELKM